MERSAAYVEKLRNDNKRLTDEVIRLRAALKQICTRPGAGFNSADSMEWLENVLRIADEALERS